MRQFHLPIIGLIEITITETNVNCKIGSYDGVLKDKNYPFSKEEFEILKEKALQLEKPSEKYSLATGVKRYELF